MHSFLDQISALLSNTPINSLQNNELYSQLPASGLFSSLLSEFSGAAEDANIAALSGNIVPTLSVQSAHPVTTDSLIHSNGGVNDGLNGASAKAPALPVVALDLDPAAPQMQVPLNTQLQQVVASTVNKEPLNRNVATDKQSINHSGGNLHSSGDVQLVSRLPLADNGKLENIARPLSTDQLVPPAGHQAAREFQNEVQINSSRNTTAQVIPVDQTIPVTEKLNVRETQSDLATKSPVAIDNTTTAKTKSHSELINVSDDLPNANSVIQNKSSQSPAPSTTNTSVNLLDPRERLLTPVANAPVRNQDDGVLIDNKIPSENIKPVVSQATEVTNRTHDQNRFVFDAETIASHRTQETPVKHETVDIRRDSVIASTVIRDQSEYTKQVENRTSSQLKPEQLYQFTSGQDRVVTRSDYSSPIPQNFIVESAPEVKIVEINISQKTPVTINVGADAVSSLNLVNSDNQLLPLREILPSDSSSSTIRTSDVRNGNEIAEQIAWARQNNAQQLRISVSPEHLGAVDISIDDAADGLNIQFVTQNLQAKEALELFMPRLKEMLEQSGLNLQNASVSQQGEGKQQFNLFDQSSNELVQHEIDDDISVTQTDVVHNQASHSSNQLLDAFA